MGKGKMTYKQFVTKYSETPEDKRNDLCASHIVNQYVNYEEKLTDVRKIAEICNYSTINDPVDETQEKVIFKRNTPLMFYLLKIRLLFDYTNIEIKDGEELTAFNALDALGAVDRLISCIPKEEIVKWNTMLEMVNDDIYMNERDFASYCDTKVDALGMVMNTMISSLGDFVGKLEQVQNEN